MGFDTKILSAPLASIFVLLLKRHKTTIYSPKVLEAAMRGAKEERGFIPISSPLRKSLWKMMIFFHVIPRTLLGFVSEMPRQFFGTVPLPEILLSILEEVRCFQNNLLLSVFRFSGSTDSFRHGRYDKQEIFTKKPNLFWNVYVLEIICLHGL